MTQLPQKLCFVDVETTGTSPTADRVIEIGIIRVEDGEVTDQFQTLINPATHISPFIEAITGISTSLIEDAPVFDTVASDILQLLEGCIFVAHNVRFDYEFIKQEYARLGVSFTAQKFCTVKLSRMLFPGSKSHNLDSIIKRHNISCENRHRAFADALVLWEFYKHLQNTMPPQEFLSAINHCLKRPTFPTKIPNTLIDSLHEGPGVYIFHGNRKEGSGGVPLYVGKSIHVKERVLSHFTQNSISTDMKLSTEATDIEVIPTAGELGALIRESQLIKKLQPLYNRALRRNRELVAIIKTTNTTGYEGASIATIKQLPASDIHLVLAICKSKRQAQNMLRRICKEHQLCPKLLGLENGSGRCMHNQFGWCKGACILNEEALTYNLRMLKAFGETKLLTWPFDGPIAITETHAHTKRQETFIIDQWCYISAQNEHDLVEKSEDTLILDLDIYKILKRFLRNKKNSKYIQTLTYKMGPRPESVPEELPVEFAS